MSHYRTQDPYSEGFLMNLNVEICIPYDGDLQSYCLTPNATGFDIVVNGNIDVCNPVSTNQMSGGSYS